MAPLIKVRQSAGRRLQKTHDGTAGPETAVGDIVH